MADDMVHRLLARVADFCQGEIRGDGELRLELAALLEDGMTPHHTRLLDELPGCEIAVTLRATLK